MFRSACTRQLTGRRTSGDNLSRQKIVWLIPILLTLHNAEEAIAFRSYMPRMQAVLPEPFARVVSSLSYSTMLLALTGLSALAFIIAFGAAARPYSPRMLWALLALEAAVCVNALAHLVSAAILFQGYGPGLVTAVFINAPFGVYCFRQARHEQWLSNTALQATVPAAFILHGPVLLAVLWLAGQVSR